MGEKEGGKEKGSNGRVAVRIVDVGQRKEYLFASDKNLLSNDEGSLNKSISKVGIVTPKSMKKYFRYRERKR